MAFVAAPMTLSLRSGEDRPSLAISGHVVESDVCRIVSALDHLTGENYRCVSLDLSEVCSIDTAALDCLAESAHAHSERHLRLSRASGEVQRHLTHHPIGRYYHVDEQLPECDVPGKSWKLDVFSLPSDSIYCREARHRVRQVARDAGLEDHWIGDMLVAVGEAVTNAIKYGHSGREDSTFTVSCLASSDRLSVSVSDNGPGFVPALAAAGEIDWFAESGRGVQCMYSLADDVSFSFNGGTTVRLVKNYG
ncbi:MAG: hypothetical protein GX139_06390 [Armatimonadetes bacterium]|nr:hypothetical protein [Armatimonadota bacterium]